MAIIIDTDRLYLREFTLKDANALYEMNSNPEVLQYTGDVPFKDTFEVRKFIEKYDHYEKYDMGRWAVCLKSNDEVLGWCGLKFHPDDKLVDVGYRFLRKHWNQGYATEAVLASIKYGFKTLRLKQIVAHVHIDNQASHKVVIKSGMHYVKDFIYNNQPAKLYHISNPYYNIKQISDKETYPVRHPILRKGRPIESCAFDGDELKTTLHLGLYFDHHLIGVVTLLKKINESFDEAKQYQLRGMAVLVFYQKKGLGELLVKKGEDSIKEQGCNFIWMNARQVAVNFYERLGYKRFGDEFEIPKAGSHYIMNKYLSDQ